MEPNLTRILSDEIAAHDTNLDFTEAGLKPLFSIHEKARIAIVGQAPGTKAQTSGIPWNDLSGERLMTWLGVDEAQFRDPRLFAHIPMDFYYPGKGKSGDLPPRKDFAKLWHGRALELMPDIELTILIGQYAQRFYLGSRRKRILTDTVHSFSEYLPEYFPIVHPSPLNFRWFMKNPWFEEVLVPELQQTVSKIIDSEKA